MGQKNCMVCTSKRMLVGGELKGSGRDGIKETAWFVLVSEWWCVEE
jgi:hypothetical protein